MKKAILAIIWLIEKIVVIVTVAKIWEREKWRDKWSQFDWENYKYLQKEVDQLQDDVWKLDEKFYKWLIKD